MSHSHVIIGSDLTSVYRCAQDRPSRTSRTLWPTLADFLTKPSSLVFLGLIYFVGMGLLSARLCSCSSRFCRGSLSLAPLRPLACMR